MKRKLALPLILALFCSVAPAQKITKAKASPAVAAFADSLANLRAAYYAYFRMWDDLDAPAPRVRRDPAYYKLFVPPTYYEAPIKQAFDLTWTPDARTLTATGGRFGLSCQTGFYSVVYCA